MHIPVVNSNSIIKYYTKSLFKIFIFSPFLNGLLLLLLFVLLVHIYLVIEVRFCSLFVRGFFLLRHLRDVEGGQGGET